MASEVDIHIKVIVRIVDKKRVADDGSVAYIVSQDALVSFVMNGEARPYRYLKDL